jgi:hypothetical protein
MEANFQIQHRILLQTPAIVGYFSSGNHYIFSYMPPLSASDIYHFDNGVHQWQKWARQR